MTPSVVRFRGSSGRFCHVKVSSDRELARVRKALELAGIEGMKIIPAELRPHHPIPKDWDNVLTIHEVEKLRKTEPDKAATTASSEKKTVKAPKKKSGGKRSKGKK